MHLKLKLKLKIYLFNSFQIQYNFKFSKQYIVFSKVIVEWNGFKDMSDWLLSIIKTTTLTFVGVCYDWLTVQDNMSWRVCNDWQPIHKMIVHGGTVRMVWLYRRIYHGECTDWLTIQENLWWRVNWLTDYTGECVMESVLIDWLYRRMCHGECNQWLTDYTGECVMESL